MVRDHGAPRRAPGCGGVARKITETRMKQIQSSNQLCRCGVTYSRSSQEDRGKEKGNTVFFMCILKQLYNACF